MQQLSGFVKFLTVADIPTGGTNCFISERNIPEEVLDKDMMVFFYTKINYIIKFSYCRFLLKSIPLMLVKLLESLLQVYNIVIAIIIITFMPKFRHPG